jgi:hypothetical protein
MPTYGRQVIGSSTGNPIQLSSDGWPEWMTGGSTVDWSLVAAVAGSDVTSPEGFTVKVGQKWLRFGQVMAKVSGLLAQTITETGVPTGGSFNVFGTRPDTGFSNTATVAFNSSVAATQAAMDSIFGAGNTVVSGAGALPANVQTVTFQGNLANIMVPTLTLGLNALTGGTTPNVAFATSANANTGKYGPYDPGASDGRQTLVPGSCGLLNESVVQNGILGVFSLQPTDNPGLVTGGRVWLARVLQTGAAAHTLAGGPTFAELMAALPRLQPVND